MYRMVGIYKAGERLRSKSGRRDPSPQPVTNLPYAAHVTRDPPPPFNISIDPYPKRMNPRRTGEGGTESRK